MGVVTQAARGVAFCLAKQLEDTLRAPFSVIFFEEVSRYVRVLLNCQVWCLWGEFLITAFDRLTKGSWHFGAVTMFQCTLVWGTLAQYQTPLGSTFVCAEAEGHASP